MNLVCCFLCCFLILTWCSSLRITLTYAREAVPSASSQENERSRVSVDEKEKAPIPADRRQSEDVSLKPQQNLAQEQTEQIRQKKPTRRRHRKWRKRTVQLLESSPRKRKKRAWLMESTLIFSGAAAVFLLLHFIKGNATERRARHRTLDTPELFVPLEILSDIPLPFMAEEDNTLQVVTGASAVENTANTSTSSAEKTLIKWEWTSVNLSIPGLPIRPLCTAEQVSPDSRVFQSPRVSGSFHIAPKADLERNIVAVYHPQVQNNSVSYRIERASLDASYKALTLRNREALRVGSDFVAQMEVKGFWFPPPPDGVSPAPLVHLSDEKVTVFELAPGTSDLLIHRNENLNLPATAAFMSKMTAWSLGRWLMTRKSAPQIS